MMRRRGGPDKHRGLYFEFRRGADPTPNAPAGMALLIEPTDSTATSWNVWIRQPNQPWQPLPGAYRESPIQDRELVQEDRAHLSTLIGGLTFQTVTYREPGPVNILEINHTDRARGNWSQFVVNKGRPQIIEGLGVEVQPAAQRQAWNDPLIRKRMDSVHIWAASGKNGHRTREIEIGQLVVGNYRNVAVIFAGVVPVEPDEDYLLTVGRALAGEYFSSKDATEHGHQNNRNTRIYSREAAKEANRFRRRNHGPDAPRVSPGSVGS